MGNALCFLMQGEYRSGRGLVVVMPLPISGVSYVGLYARNLRCSWRGGYQVSHGSRGCHVFEACHIDGADDNDVNVRGDVQQRLQPHDTGEEDGTGRGGNYGSRRVTRMSGQTLGRAIGDAAQDYPRLWCKRYCREREGTSPHNPWIEIGWNACLADHYRPIPPIQEVFALN